MSTENRTLAGAIRALAMTLACLGVVSLTAVSLMVVANAVLRSFFSIPILGTDEIASLLSLLAVVSFLPVSFLDDHHLEIDLVMRGLGDRTYRLVGIVAGIIVAVFLATMTWQLALFTQHARQSGDATWFLMLKTWPWWTAVCVTVAISFVAQAVMVARRIGSVAGGNGD